MMSSPAKHPRDNKHKTKGGSKNTCEGKGTIQRFFNGTARALVKKKTVVCPICAIDVELVKINEHMDSPQCQTNKAEVIEEVKSTGSKRDHPESFSDGEKNLSFFQMGYLF